MLYCVSPGLRVPVFVNVYITDSSISLVLFDRGLVPPSKGAEVTERRVLVIMGIPVDRKYSYSRDNEITNKCSRSTSLVPRLSCVGRESPPPHKSLGTRLHKYIIMWGIL